jgi:prefoldin subunit 1
VKDRERRIVQLTIRELEGMGSDVNVYKGVGKMYVCALPHDGTVTCGSARARFMQVPRPTMQKELKAQEKELADDLSNLNKKVRASCLHRTAEV